MSKFNMPPGIDSGMIPGNRKEDIDWEDSLQRISEIGTEQGYDSIELLVVFGIGVAAHSYLKRVGTKVDVALEEIKKGMNDDNT